MKTSVLLFVLFLFHVPALQAQLVQQTESFESSSIFPPPGWRPSKTITNVNGGFVLQAAASATNPAPGSAPGGGAQLMMLNAFSAANNDTAIIISKPFDFSNNAGVNPQFSFYMFRDNGFAANDDHIRVYINTVPGIDGATLLSNTLGTNRIPRHYLTAPAAVANTWNQYTFDLPAATYNQRRYYFIFMGVCKDGNNIYLDRVSTNTYPSAMNLADVSFSLTQQNAASAGPGAVNHMVVGIRCVVGGTSGCGVVNGALSSALKLDSLLLNTNGTSSLTDIDDAKMYYTGGSPLFDTSYVSPFPVTAGTDDYPSRRFGATLALPATNMDFVNGATSCFYLEYDTTYFWLSYDVKASAVSGNFLDAEFRGAAIGGAAGSCPSPFGSSTPKLPDPGGYSLPGASQIDLSYCIGTYSGGTSGWGGNYTTNDYVQSVVLNGAQGTSINTNFGASNNNTGLPPGLPCLVNNGGPGCDFTVNPPSYELWPAVPGRTTVLVQGTSYVVTVQAGAWYSGNNIAVFIDFNHDGDFADAGEKLGQVNLLANQSGAITFVIPPSGYTGMTRMRVRDVYAVSNIDPCQQYNFGETEDFYVVISPSCIAGYTLWLGNTDDWSNPVNWCGGVPALSDDAVISRALVFPPAGLPSRPYYKPVIKSNDQARAANLSISNLDTLLIDAPSPAAVSLKVRKDLTNNGHLGVQNAYGSTSTFGRGSLVNNIYTPFKALATDARTQIIYSATELSQAGWISGDRIKAIQFQVSFKGSLSPFSNFTIGYALVPFSQHSSNVPYAGAITPVYGPASYSTVSGLNTINLSTPVIWDGSSHLLIQYCYDNVSNSGANDDRIHITQTTGIKSTLILSTTSNAASGCVLLPGAGVTDNFFSALSSYRPNFSFVLDRPYGKAVINLQEDWINNGSFSAGYSRVVMDSTLLQTIGGTQNTTFSEWQISKSSPVQTVTQLRDVSIDSSLVLTQGILQLNGRQLIMNNPAVSGGTLDAPSGPFSRQNGFLLSESANSTVVWKNLQAVGYRVLPFGSSASSPMYIPFSFTHQSGVLGDVSVATYNAPGNSPWPPGVTHLNNTGGSNNAANTTDRFWILGKTGLNPQTNITFRFTPAERPAGMSALNGGRAQPWRVYQNSEAWIRLLNPYTTLTYTQNYGVRTVPSAFDSVRVVNYDWPTGGPSGPLGNANPWAIATNSSPLGEMLTASLNVTLAYVSNETCPGSQDGAISILVTGGSAPYAYVWSNGASTQNLSNLSAATYTVTVTDANGTTFTLGVAVGLSNSLPLTPGAVSGKAFGVCGLTLGYSVPLVSGMTYNWSVPSGVSILSGQGSNSVSLQFSNAFVSGQIAVTANNFCGNSNARTKTLYGRPSKPVSMSGPAVFCKDDTVSYSVPSVFGASTYLWTVPIGILILNGQGTNTISVTGVSSSLSGDICVKAGNSCAASGYFCRSVAVNIPPQPLSNIGGAASGVCGQTLAYSVLVQQGIAYNWSMPSGATLVSGQGTNNIVVAYANSNVTGSLSVTASGACGTPVSRSKNIRGTPLAPVSIAGPGSICYNQQNVTYSCPPVSGAVSYTWTLPAGTSVVSGQGSNVIVLNFNGSAGNTESLKVRAVNACGQSGNRVINVMLQACPREGMDVQEELLIYPNPAKDLLHILCGDKAPLRLDVYDLTGALVLRSGNAKTLSLTGLSEGMYFLKAWTDEGIVVRRFEVMR